MSNMRTLRSSALKHRFVHGTGSMTLPIRSIHQLLKEADFERSRFQAAGAIYRALTLRGEDAGEYEDWDN